MRPYLTVLALFCGAYLITSAMFHSPEPHSYELVQVVDADCFAPVPHATVEYHDPELVRDWSVQTDRDGQCILPFIRERARVTVHPPADSALQSQVCTIHRSHPQVTLLPAARSPEPIPDDEFRDAEPTPVATLTPFRLDR